jgi:hypothetical protein
MDKKRNSELDNNKDTSESNVSESQEDNSEINDIEFDPKTFFQSPDFCLYKKVNRYYKTDCTDENKQKMLQIINGTSPISLRILDWFVTKYSKQRRGDVVMDNNEVIDVRISYKTQLSSYRKKNLDPFRRRRKFLYPMILKDENINITTTLGQLNFFKWAFSENIIIYVEKNLKIILGKMNEYNKEDKKKKTLKQEIINDVVIKNIVKVNSPNKLSQEDIKLVITFD